jgi:hypothetical protein
MRTTLLRAAVAAMPVLALLAGGRQAGATEALRPTVKEMAASIAEIVRKKNGSEAAVGDFSGPAGMPASAGQGIKKLLIDELQANQIAVKTGFGVAFQVKGDYDVVTDPDTQVMALHVKARVIDSQRAEVPVVKTVSDRNVIAQVLGVNKPDLGAGLTPQAESKKLEEQLKKPNPGVAGTKLRANPNSPYAIEVLVERGKGNYQPVTPSDDGGFAFVALQKEDRFAVQLVNDSDHAAAVELTLDGLSMFAFSEHKGYRHVILKPHSTGLIKGWHRTNELSNKFAIGDYAEGAVKELGASADGVGTITATFAAAWDLKEGPPADENSKFRDPFGPAVKRAEEVRAPYQEVKMELGRVRDVVNVRYKMPQ